PVHLLKFPHHGSKSNYFPNLFAQIAKGCHVIVSGYTKGDSDSLKKLFAHGASSITMLLQDGAKAGEMMRWAGYTMLATSTGGALSAWKDALVTVNANGTAAMTGSTWQAQKGFNVASKLGAGGTIDLLTGAPAVAVEGDDDEKGAGDDDGDADDYGDDEDGDEKAGGSSGAGDGDDEKKKGSGASGGGGKPGAPGQWAGWTDVNGRLMFRQTWIVGVSYDGEGSEYVLTPTTADGSCFYRCCARFLNGNDAGHAALRARLAATYEMGSANRTRIAK